MRETIRSSLTTTLANIQAMSAQFRQTGETGFRRIAFCLCGLAAVFGMPIWK